MLSGAPTRQTLILLKRRRVIVKNGRELLRNKREALMKEFLGLVDDCLVMREELSEILSKGTRALELSRALRPGEVDSMASKKTRHINLDIKIENVWGVKVPSIKETSLVRTLEARDVSAIGEGASTLETAKEYERAVALMLRMSTPESRLARVGDMIKSDTRKINAIEEVLLPEIDSKIKKIGRTLEEREKAEIYRMKRYKTKRAAMPS